MRFKRVLLLGIGLLFFGLTGEAAKAFPINLRRHNFGEVEADKIYRSARPSEKFLRKLVTGEVGVKTIVVLEGFVPESIEVLEAEYGLTVYHLPMTVRKFPSKETVGQFLAILQDKNHFPILIHCKHGADRTGLMVALYRIEAQKRNICPDVKREMSKYRNFRWFEPMPKVYLKHFYDPKCIKPANPEKIEEFLRE